MGNEKIKTEVMRIGKERGQCCVPGSWGQKVEVGRGSEVLRMKSEGAKHTQKTESIQCHRVPTLMYGSVTQQNTRVSGTGNRNESIEKDSGEEKDG